MSLLSALFGGGDNKTTSTSTNSSEYNLDDHTKGVGDGSLFADNGASIKVITNNTTLDAELARASVSASANLADRALRDAAATRNAASDATGGANYLVSQAIGATVNGQTLQAMLSADNSKVLIAANDNASIDYGKLLSNTTNGFSNLLDAANRSQKDSLSFATDAAENYAAASRASTAAAAGIASDSIFAVKESARDSLNFADGAIGAINTNNRAAFGFADGALTSINTGNRAAFGFAGDALAAQLSTSNRAATTAENALDGSFSFAKGQTTNALSFAGDALTSVIRLVSDTAKSTQGESAATREFAGKFVGDFYESQKSGDVQTIQQAVKYGTAALAIIAIAWAIKSNKA